MAFYSGTNVWAAGGTLIGSGAIRAGYIINIKFNINDSGKHGEALGLVVWC